MRSPSGAPSGSARGDAPVAISTASACTVAPSASIVCGLPSGPSASRPLARITRMPSAAMCSAMSFDWSAASALIRV